MPTPDKLLPKEAIAKFEREKKRGFPEKADATRQQSSQMKQKVEQQAKQGTKRLTQQRANRAYNEIESRRKKRDAGITINNQPVSQRSSDAYAATHGEIKDGNQVQLDKAMAQWGLHSGLGQMTNISDQWRATPSFANFVGRSTPEAMAMAGSLVANPVGTILGMGTGYLGSQAGGYVGEQLGNREAGEIAGSLVGMPFGYKVGTTLQRTVPRTFLGNTVNGGITVNGQRVLRKPYITPQTVNEGTVAPGLVNDQPIVARGREPITVNGKQVLVKAFEPEEKIGQFTLQDIHDFYTKYPNLTENEMLASFQKFNGQHKVIINGRPTSYERVIRPNYNKIFEEIPEEAVQEKVVEPLATGKKRRIQLEKAWNEAEKSIEELKQEHPISTETKQFSDVTELPLEKQIDRLYTSEGQIEQPITWQEIQNNPELERFVNEVRDKGVPINPETGEPIIATFDTEGNLVPTNRLASLLAYRTGKNSKIGSMSDLTRDEPFIEGLRGTQQLLDRETLLPNGEVVEGGTKTFGELGFATDQLLAALNYADVLTHDQLLYVVNSLRARGYNIPTQSVDYAESLINNIRQRQIAEKIKLGRYKEEFRTGLKVPRAEFEETNGVGDTDAARMRGIWRSNETPVESDWKDYINNMIRYNRFFGSQQGHGGVQTVLMRRPRYTWEKPFDMGGKRFNEPIDYDNGIQYKDIHALETFLGNDSGFRGRDLINGRNPLLMRTLIAPRGSYFYGHGLKKGGKLIKKPKIMVTSSK